VPRRAAAIEAVYVTLAGVSATGVPPSAATGASGEPAVQLPHRGGELLMSRAGVSAPDVTPSEANGAAGEPVRMPGRMASGRKRRTLFWGLAQRLRGSATALPLYERRQRRLGRAG